MPFIGLAVVSKQWGNSSHSNGSVGTVTFPLKYSLACYGVLLTMIIPAGRLENMYPSNLSTSSFKWQGLKNTAETIYWISYGK